MRTQPKEINRFLTQERLYIVDSEVVVPDEWLLFAFNIFC